jgi:hypothetical protein
MRLARVFLILAGTPIILWSQSQKPTARASNHKPIAEKYELIDNPTKEFGLLAQVSATDMVQSADCEGGVEGRVDWIEAGGKNIELVTHDIVQESGKAWIVTKRFGKIRVSGCYAGDRPPSGLGFWMKPSQKAALKAFSQSKIKGAKRGGN